MQRLEVEDTIESGYSDAQILPSNPKITIFVLSLRWMLFLMAGLAISVSSICGYAQPTFSLTPQQRELVAKEARRYQEYIVKAEVEYDGGLFGGGRRKVPIEGVLVLPDAEQFKAPYPLMVINHGSQPRTRPNTYNAFNSGWRPLTYFFNLNGYAIFFPIRKGFTRANGPEADVNLNLSEPISCENISSMVAGLSSAKADAKALLEVLATRDDIDMSRVILGGISRGGILSLELAADGFPGTLAVINWVGRWHSEPCPENALFRTTFNDDKFRRFGERITVPILSVYGDRDPEHPSNHIARHMELLGRNPHLKIVELPGADHYSPTHYLRWLMPVRAFLQDVVSK